jgi:hypothetical protein
MYTGGDIITYGSSNMNLESMNIGSAGMNIGHANFHIGCASIYNGLVYNLVPMQWHLLYILTNLKSFKLACQYI